MISTPNYIVESLPLLFIYLIISSIIIRMVQINMLEKPKIKKLQHVGNLFY